MRKAFGVGALLAATILSAAAQTVNLNCGGTGFTTSDGTQWSSDSYYAGGDQLYTGYSISNTNPQDYYLLRSARQGLYGDFSYAIPVPNGTYTVSLTFAELLYTGKGDRVFNVVLNGSTVLSNFDILTQVPVLTPLKQQFTTSTTNGMINISFVGVNRRAIVNAIQIAPAGAGTTTGTTTPALALSGNALSFAGTAGSSNPGAQTITVSNAGGGTLTWTAASNQSWLTVSPASGTNTGTLSIATNLAGLAAGTYSGTVTVTGGGATKTITAVLSVAAASAPSTNTSSTTPSLQLSAASLTFSANAGGTSPAPQTVTVSNAGGGTMTWWSATTQTWILVSPGTGTNAGTLSITCNVTPMGTGTYQGQVYVNAGGGGVKSVNVTFVVGPQSTTSTGTSSTGTSSTGTSTGTTSGTSTGTTSGTSTGTSGSTTTTTSAPPPSIPASSGNNWYVTTSGSSGGNGSASSPWDLATALSATNAVHPGDTIWVHGGRYGGGQSNSTVHSTLVGTPSAPIIVRAYPGERVTIDEWLQVGCCDGAPNPSVGSYTWFWGLEFAGFNTDRTAGTSGPPSYGATANHNGVDIWAPGTKVINSIVHDTGGGISIWSAGNSEATGNIVYYVGGAGPDRGHGHLFYLQNAAPSVLNLNDNIGFNSFDIGVQAYGSNPGPYVQNMNFNGNAIMNAGMLYGSPADNIAIGSGNGGPSGMSLKNNYFYYPLSQTGHGYNELGYLWSPHGGDVTAIGNYFIGGAQAIDLERWDRVVFQNNLVYGQGSDESMWLIGSGQSTSNYQVSGNQYYGNAHFTLYTGCDGWPCGGGVGMGFSSWLSNTGLDSGSTSASTPSGVQIFVRPNAYEAGRANIMVFNWAMQGSVQVDLSGSGIKVGDRFQIRDGQNWYGGAVVTGTYSGAPVTIPMTGLAVAQPVGSTPGPALHTAPTMGTFVLLSGTALTNTF